MTDYIKSVLVSEEEISTLCDRIADQITEDYKNSDKKLVLVCILKGSLMFTSELMKRIPLPLEVDFMKVSSYGSKTVSSGYINIHLDIKREDISDVDFIVIEDIIDSGKTLSYLVEYLKLKGAKSVKTCTLLDKPDRREVDFEAEDDCYYGSAERELLTKLTAYVRENGKQCAETICDLIIKHLEEQCHD